MMFDPANHYLPDVAASALPGERVNISNEDEPPIIATTTHLYMYQYGFLFRKFVWLDAEILDPIEKTSAGIYLVVRGHWRQFRRAA